ncbi:Protein of unknown function [Bacillus toyonensis]|nr:Protein of unknown function [Bacillus toyonensis]
MSDSDNHYQE